MITSKKIITDLKKTLKDFGEYMFRDKRAHEVMDVKSYGKELVKLSAKQAGQILKDVAKKHVLGQHLIDSIVVDMDNLDISDEWWIEMIEVSGANY